MRRVFVIGLVLLAAGCAQETLHKGKPVRVWLEGLKGPWPDTRMRAAIEAGEIGPDARAAVPDLIELLADRNHLVRWAAAGALGKLGCDSAPALPALRKLAKED